MGGMDGFGEWQRSLALTHSPKTIKLWAYWVSRCVREVGEHPSTDDLVDWLAGLPAAETRKSARSAIRSYWSWRARRGLGVDPTADLPRIRVPAGQPRPASDRDILLALAGTDDPRLRIAICLAAFAGLRRSEICAVHSRDLVADDLLAVHGKGGKMRVVPLPPWLAEAVAAAGGPLINGRRGPLTPDALGRLARQAGVRLHELRHRFATTAYRRSHDLLAVQRLLGHSRPETTMRYALIDIEELRATAAAAQIAA